MVFEVVLRLSGLKREYPYVCMCESTADVGAAYSLRLGTSVEACFKNLDQNDLLFLTYGVCFSFSAFFSFQIEFPPGGFDST